jgi:hypothetical protein
MMKYKYSLPENWRERVDQMEEFANGATQVTIRLTDGKEVSGVLISDSVYIIATRGFKDLPFSVDDIEEIFQTEIDKNPRDRGGWDFWDNWVT